MENNITIKRQLTKAERKIYPDVAGYDENGKPIFKKKIKDSNILNKRSKSEKVLYIIIFIIFCIHSFTLIFPTAWMAMAALKGSFEYAVSGAFEWPERLLFENYIKAFQTLNAGNTSFAGMIFNSLWYTGIKTFMWSMIPAMVGYAMTRFKFWGRDIIYGYVIFTLTFPIYGSGGAMMRLVANLGLYNTPMYIVVTNICCLSSILLVYQGFYRGLSNSYAEAAKMDGANAFVIYFKVIMPQARPIMLTYAITTAIGSWNTYEDVILYLPDFPTLASGLLEYKSLSEHEMPSMPFYFAGVLISAIPTLLLFAFFSDKIMTSLSIGGLKG